MALRVLSNVAADSHSTSARQTTVHCPRPTAAAAAPGRLASAQTASRSAYNLQFVAKIEHGTRVFSFARPLTIQILREVDEGGCYWQANAPKFGIFSIGDTVKAAMDEFSEDFAAVWDGLAFEQDESLTPDAQELKRELRALVTTD